MKKASFILLIISLALCVSCRKEENGPEDSTGTLPDGEDISITSLVTPLGGTLELEDEKGTLLKVSFPAMAVADSIEVTLHMKGSVEEQPLEMRHIRSFEILPEDLRLYEALQISLIFKEKQENLELSGLFRVPSQGRLQALGEYTWSASGDTLRASSVRTGSFTEGIMTVEEILLQVDQIYAVYNSNAKGSHSVSDAAGDIADAWADLHADIKSTVSFYDLLKENDFYNDNPGEFEKDQSALCEKVVCKGVDMILKMAVPKEDPCNRDYMKTIGDMVRSMDKLGCGECKAYELARERFSQLIRDCRSYLDTDMYFEVSGDGFLSQHDHGSIEISARFDEYGVVVVEGSGELSILGEMEVDECSGIIEGTSTVFVYGFRDAAFNYTLNLIAEDQGNYHFTCPDGSFVKAFTSEQNELVVELNPGNNFTWDKDYPIDGGGVMNVYVRLFNPWAGTPPD
ncbi:MAG: hypothetical protein QNK35_13015 [Bacteroides sp.]|nr:hypothetical protein [Bacteroides sp.]